MEQVVDLASRSWHDFWVAAVDPLHKLSWQTGVLVLFLLLAAALIAGMLLRYSWVFSKPAMKAAIIKHVPHTMKGHLRLSPPDYLKYHRLKPTISVEEGPGASRVNKDSSRYYLVTVVETGKRKSLLYKEMKLHVATRRGRAQERTVQFDAEDLTTIRMNNGHEEDDAPDADIAGEYDIYIRRVRFYDVRHWLMHPAREIRTVVWVTLITTTVPTIIQIFFG